MTKLYLILSVAGWAWFVLVAIFFVIRFTIGRKTTRGFEVIEPQPRKLQPQTHGARDVGSGGGGGFGGSEGGGVDRR